MNWLEQTSLKDILHLATFFLITGGLWLISKQFQQDNKYSLHDKRIQKLENTTVSIDKFQELVNKVTVIETTMATKDNIHTSENNIINEIRGKQS